MKRSKTDRKLTQDNRTGLFRRDLGWKHGKSGLIQQRFYLGRDEQKAALAEQRLKQLWDAIEATWGHDHLGNGQPVWDETTLTIGQAIARGEFVCRLELPTTVQEAARLQGDFVLHGWLNQLRQAFGTIIGLELANHDLATKAEAAQVERGEYLKEVSSRIVASTGKVSNGQTLHGAIDAYIRWLETKFVTAPEDGMEQRTSQTGKKQAERAARLKRHHGDMPLSDFGAREIDAMLLYWANRPALEGGGAYAFTTCKHQVRLIKHFLKWLHKNGDFAWKKPTDYEFDRIRVLAHPHEIAKRITPHQVQTFTKDQLALLWRYATPLERVFLCLALNCGFGIGEIATLRDDEIHDGYIKRLRHKSKVYGEWKLWTITLEAIRWAKEKQREAGVKSPLVLTTETGQSYLAPTKANNRGARIPNAWNRLIARIRKDHHDFPKFSFGKLRKTAGDLVRKFADGEVAGIFLAHGQAVRSDELADVYTNRPFDRVFLALDRIWEHLRGIFVGGFGDATPATAKITIGTIRRIQILSEQGMKPSKIAEVCGVALTTVRRYSKPKDEKKPATRTPSP
jgi:hypothetical protein